MQKIANLLVLLAVLHATPLAAQCNPDTEPPVVVAKNNLGINILPGGQITIWATDLLDTVQDNCTPNNLIQLAIRRAGEGSGFPTNPDGSPQIYVRFDCCDLGTQFVELWARDTSGNSSMDSALMVVQDNIGLCSPCGAKVSACAYTRAGDLIADMQWDLAVQHPALPPGHISSIKNCANFLAVPFVSSLTITPSKNTDPLDGVSTFDLVLINKHILGLTPLNSPYQLIAADANNSRTVSTFDIVELRKLILGVYTGLPKSNSWRFVPKDYPFPDPSNPFASIFPEGISILNLLSDLSVAFTGVKIGDVSSNATPDSLAVLEERSDMTLQLNDVFLQPGQTARIALRLGEAADLLGLQFALQFDPSVLEISGLSLSERLTSSQPLTSPEAFYAQPHAGLLSFSWDDIKAPTIPAGDPILFLEIKALQALQLSEALRLYPERLQPELYTSSGATNRLNLLFSAAPNIGPTQLFPAAPNPSSGAVDIPLALAKPGWVLLELFDLNGRLIYRRGQNLPAGLQRLELPSGAFSGQAGLLLYRVVAGDFVGAGKLVRN